MVHLHGAIANRSPYRYTEDIDLIFDLRINLEAIEKAHQVLEQHGFEVDGVSAEGLAHRYINSQRVEVDILAPDNLGERATPKLRTPQGRTVSVPGGTKALQYACAIDAVYRDRRETLFIPDLLTAVMIKIKAMNLPSGRTEGGRPKHLDDIAFLLSLVEDPDELLTTPVAQEIKLSAASALDDAAHPSWRIQGEYAEDGYAVWEILRDYECSV